MRAQTQTSVETLWAALHQPSHALTAPELYQVLGEAKTFYWLLPQLLDRMATQLDRRASSGGLHDDRGPDHDPSETAHTARRALTKAATQITEAGRLLEDAHNALAHLGDDRTGLQP
jgi:hypothetical protein